MAPSLAVRVRNFDGPGAVEGTPSAAIDTQAAVAALDYSVARISPSIPRSLIVELLNTYFIWYQCAFPIVSRQDFLASLAAGGEHFRPCLLNVRIAADVPRSVCLLTSPIGCLGTCLAVVRQPTTAI